jgi:hypothetical protein
LLRLDVQILSKEDQNGKRHEEGRKKRT